MLLRNAKYQHGINGIMFLAVGFVAISKELVELWIKYFLRQQIIDTPTVPVRNIFPKSSIRNMVTLRIVAVDLTAAYIRQTESSEVVRSQTNVMESSLFEKIIFPHVVKKLLSPSILFNSKIHHHFHKSTPLFPFLNQINPVHAHVLFLKDRF